MTVKEVYQTLDSDFDEMLMRLGTAERLTRFLKKFVSDGSFGELRAALERGDRETAFRYAHTVKGICLNLGLKALTRSASDLTDALRGNETRGDTDQLFAAAEKDYITAIDTIKKLD